jgi:benzaldehyde dehydrogenase (NAD)
MSVIDTAVSEGRLYSDGWREGGAGTTDVVEPATGDALTRAGVAAPADVAQAAASAAAAQPAWAASWPERAAVLRRAAQLLEHEAPAATEWLVREAGSIPGKAKFEVQLTLGELHEAGALPSRPYGELLPSAVPGRTVFARRAPMGIVGVITPWNFPLVLAMRAVAPALALGNAVVLKPDLQTPVSGGFVIAQLFEEAGLPPGVLHVLPGDAEPGEALVTDENIDMVSFTGSSAVGRRVGELAGARLKRVLLELGGNSALVVLDDADLDRAASNGAWGSFLHQGQICMSTSRHLVHESVADEYLERLAARTEVLTVGNPHTDEVALGPLINDQQLARVDGIVRNSEAAGAKVVTGGTHEGLYYRPTVLANVTPEMPAFKDEIFGPVAPVTTFADDDEAIALANGTAYGLSAAVQTGSVTRGLALADRIEAGMVHVNDQTVNDQANVPFGGVGVSGNGGRFGGQANVDEFTQWQIVTARDEPTIYPF